MRGFTWEAACVVQDERTRMIQVLVCTTKDLPWRLPDETELDEVRAQGICAEKFA